MFSLFVAYLHFFYIFILSLGPTFKKFLNAWQAKVHNLAGDDYRSSVLESIKQWIQVIFFCLCDLFSSFFFP